MNMFLVALALVASTAAAPQWTETEYQPLAQEAYADDLVAEGFRNGRMPSYRMIEVNGCLLERDAAYAFALMADAARADGIELDTEDCYRSLDQQQAAYDRRCPEQVRETAAVDPATGETMVLSSETVRVCTGPPTARPGTSNHGWGRAIDFADRRSTLDCRDEEFVWLNENAGRFGWVHPDWAGCGRSGAEPWHWEWGGVTEAPPPPPTEIDPDLAQRIR